MRETSGELVELVVATRRPEDYVLLDTKTQQAWEIRDGRWVLATDTEGQVEPGRPGPVSEHTRAGDPDRCVECSKGADALVLWTDAEACGHSVRLWQLSCR